MSEKQKRYRSKAKRDAIAQYGGKCVCCGERDIDELCIPRRLGNEAYWEEVEKSRSDEPEGGWNLYVWLRVREYPNNFGFYVVCKACAKYV